MAAAEVIVVSIVLQATEQSLTTWADEHDVDDNVQIIIRNTS